jgi:hypothetical protein
MLSSEYTLRLAPRPRRGDPHDAGHPHQSHAPVERRGVSATDRQPPLLWPGPRLPLRLPLRRPPHAPQRAWAAQPPARFSPTCRQRRPGRNGFLPLPSRFPPASPRFQRACRSVEDQQTSWPRAAAGKRRTLGAGGGMGRVRPSGSRELATCLLEQSQRLLRLRRAGWRWPGRTDAGRVRCVLCVRCVRCVVPWGAREPKRLGTAGLLRMGERASVALAGGAKHLPVWPRGECQ